MSLCYLKFVNAKLSTTICARKLICVIAVLVSSSLAWGQDDTKTDESAVALQIVDVEFVNQSAFNLKVKIRNTSDQPWDLNISQFQFRSGDRSYPFGNSVRSPLLAGPKRLEKGEEAEGFISLKFLYSAADDPEMELLCQLGGNDYQLSINQAISELVRPATRLIGPNDCLAVVAVRRSVDSLSIPALTAEFQRLQQRGVQRVVLDVKATTKGQTPSYQTRLMISGWLGSVKKGNTPRRFSLQQPLKSSVQFSEFYVTGMGTVDPSGFSSGGSKIYQSNLGQAIAAALKSEYERIPLDLAISDMQHEEPGIRRVAIEANIDRLTEDQLDVLLQDAPAKSPEHQALVADNLHRVSVPMAVTTLELLVQSPHANVSQAALRSLVKSVSPNAVEALKQVWHESSGEEDLRQDIVSAVMAARDYRFADLLEEYARNMISSSVATAGDVGKPSPKTQAAKTNDPSTSSRSSSRSSIPNDRTLKGILDFLKEQDNNGVIVTAKSQLLKITDPALQDVVLEFLTSSGSDSEVGNIARSYIEDRLAKVEPPVDGLTPDQRKLVKEKYGPPGLRRSSRITARLFNAIRRFPDSAYTERLVELSEFDGISSSLRRTAFQVATLCARDDQLQTLIEDFDSLDRYSKDHLLKQVSALNHPQWLPLAKKCLAGDESTQFIAIGILARDNSVESMNLLIDRFAQLMETAEKKVEYDSSDAATKSSNSPSSPKSRLTAQEIRLAEKLIVSLRAARLPAARRLINRCERSPILKLNELALSAAQSTFRSDPNASALVAAARLRRNEQYAEAKTAYDAILQADPFCSSAYSSRSSLYLRTGEPELAMKDLKQALRFEPDDVLTESLIALAEVRLGRPKEGIEQMESIVESIPDLPTMVRRDALYNLACTYGRAIEIEEDKDMRDRYMKRAIEVFRDCVDREEGFDDPLHVKNDPDMNVFRTHPDWVELMEQITENETKSRLKRR